MASLEHTFQTESGIHSISIADNDCVITGSDDGTITVWDIPNRKIVRTIQTQKNHFTSLAISGDAHWAVSANSKILKVWDIPKGLLCREIETLVDRTNQLIITPEGKCLSGHDYGGLILWDIHTGERIKTMEGVEILTLAHIMAEPNGVTAMAMTADGSKVITGTYYGELRVWDLNTYKNIHSVVGHRLWVTGIILLPDGQQGISVAYDGTVKMWNIEGNITSETLYEGMPPISMIVMKPNFRRVIWGTQKGMLYFWDLKKQQIRSELSAHDKAINGAVFNSNKQLLTVSADGTLKVWNL
jgi:WD40 repeat protein